MVILEFIGVEKLNKNQYLKFSLLPRQGDVEHVEELLAVVELLFDASIGLLRRQLGLVEVDVLGHGPSVGADVRPLPIPAPPAHRLLQDALVGEAPPAPTVAVVALQHRSILSTKARPLFNTNLEKWNTIYPLIMWKVFKLALNKY